MELILFNYRIDYMKSKDYYYTDLGAMYEYYPSQMQ